MDSPAEETFPYRGGYVALSDTHLVVVRGRYRAETLALRHVNEVVAEEAHSFRHRMWGLVFGLLFLAPIGGLLLPGDGWVVVGLFTAKFGIGVVFTTVIGVVCLWGVVTSRRIWWLRVRYGTTDKLIPLPGMAGDQVERLAGLLNRVIGERA